MSRRFICTAPTALWIIVLIWCFLCTARAFPSAMEITPVRAQADDNANSPKTITIEEAASLLDVLPVTKDLRAKGMIVKWDAKSVATMNNKDYYFFWVFNATAQKAADIGSISVGNYAVNMHTADVRVWHVSHDVYYGDDGTLVSAKELQQLQDELREKHGIDSASVQKYRFALLADKIIPREEAQSATRLPIATSDGKSTITKRSHRAPEAEYHLLSFRFLRLDDTQELLVNEAGEFVAVPEGTAKTLIRKQLVRGSDLYSTSASPSTP